MVKRRASLPTQPTGLVVEVVDEELAIFTWDVERPATESLTDAERDVLARIVTGASNAAIASRCRMRPSQPCDGCWPSWPSQIAS